MAIFFPSIEIIKKFKVQPTAGEAALLNFLYMNLDDTYEVYFNAYLNGDRPDVIIMKRGGGVMIIEVKDWNLNNFFLDERKKWVYKDNGAVVKSPLDQVLKYKNNLYDLHIPELLRMKINDIRNFNVVSCAVYFHCSNLYNLQRMLVDPYKDDKKYSKWLCYNIDLLGNDCLNKQFFAELLNKHYMGERGSYLFNNELYGNFKRILSPTVHSKSEGQPYNYTTKQKEIIYSTKLEQRVKGVFGSGKTTVLAARAVQAYKRALSRNSDPKILILTYNLTLHNFIRDKINRVDELFPIQNFIIINYHKFITNELGNVGVDVHGPEGNASKEEISLYFEKEYFSNIELFEQHKDEFYKYDAVLIDEIQDYHRPWMEIIKNYFRDPLGDYVLFGDVKQNIYGNPTMHKDVATNVKGVNELKTCFRSDFKVQDIALKFQKSIFQDKYEIDDFSEEELFLGQRYHKEGDIKYMYLQSENHVVTLYNIIRGNILNNDKNIAPNDITVLGYTTELLRTFDSYYRHASREKTNSMLETVEEMYMIMLNFISKKEFEEPGNEWYKNITTHIRNKMFPNRQQLFDGDIIKLRQQIASLFAIYDLYELFGETFVEQLRIECDKTGINYDAFMAFRNFYSTSLNEFKKQVYRYDYKERRDNKKFHFENNRGMLKISTINSFKGWESEALFLIVEPRFRDQTYFNNSFDELLYTGLTRCKRNLVIINFGNEEYDTLIRSIVDAVK